MYLVNIHFFWKCLGHGMEPGSLNFSLFLGIGISSSGGTLDQSQKLTLAVMAVILLSPVFVPSPHLCLLLCLPF